MNHPNLSNAAAQKLQRLMADGVYLVGDCLPSQRKLAEALGISRTCLREAVSMLEALGLVHSHPGKGVFVTAGAGRGAAGLPVSPAGMRPEAVFQFRFALEPAAANIVAANPETDAEELVAIQTRLESALRDFDLVGAAERDMEFHRAIARLSGNEAFVSIFDQYETQIAFSLQIPFADPKGIWETAREHLAVIGAIAGRNPAAAGAAMRTHLSRAAGRAGLHFYQP
ncbi:MAG: FCD domain-containing protein [Candidatus Accumulibacter sp.]|jgi:GntR family transcriptional repressor for pyruvate dehydrogenase complex|nr:FCD domain-containing protein [Accumulibacter sp.]